MNDLNKIFAKNLTELRKQAKMTQLQLAEILNYSDKAVSKWERGESIPDVSVLIRIADCFGVSLDYLVKPHEILGKKEMSKTMRWIKANNHFVILVISCLAVFFVAVSLNFFAGLFFSEIKKSWLIFIYALPFCAVLGIVFSSIWKIKIAQCFSISALLWSAIVSIYLTFYPSIDWFIFMIGIPAQLITLLSFRIIRFDSNRFIPKFLSKDKKSKENDDGDDHC